MKNLTKNNIAEEYNKISACYDFKHISNKCLGENLALFKLLGNFGGKVLDLGCGTGLFKDYYPDFGNSKIDFGNFKIYDFKNTPPPIFNRYLGIDISDGMLKIAKAKHPDSEFLKRNIEDTGLFKNYFDLVFCLFCGVSYCNLKKTVDEIYRVLKFRGRFFLMYYNNHRFKNSEYTHSGKDLYNAYSFYELNNAYKKKFKNVRVYGFSIFTEYLPPALSSSIFMNYLLLETKLSWLFMNHCDYFIVEGVKG